MIMTQALAFDEAAFLQRLDQRTEAELNGLRFGVIGFDTQGIVRRYNTYESQAAGLSAPRVLGYALFTAVAPCMNNYLVVQRFEDATDEGGELDATIDYVLTLRTRPVKF